MKKYIRICDCCGNTFETDNNRRMTCRFCNERMWCDNMFYTNYLKKMSKQEKNNNDYETKNNESED